VTNVTELYGKEHYAKSISIISLYFFKTIIL